MAPPFHTLITKALLGVKSHVERRLVLYSRLALLGPFLVGPLVVIFSTDPQLLIESWKRYIAFVLLFASWTFLLKTVIYVRLNREVLEKARITAAEEAAKRKEKKHRKKKKIAPPPSPLPEQTTSGWPFTRLQIVGIVAALIVITLTLQVFYQYFNQIIFLLLLAIFTFGVIGDFVGRKTPLGSPRFLLSLSPRFIYFTGIGYLSCLSLHGSAYYQPLVISAAFSAMAITPGLLNHLIGLGTLHELSSDQQTEAKYLIRTYALLTAFAPASIGLLVYTGQLSNGYLATFLSLLFAARVIKALPSGKLPEKIPETLRWLGAITPIAFIVVFIVLRFL